MSLCENPGERPRGKVCRNCCLGKPGYVSKIVNWRIAKEEIRNEINRLAGEIWLGRGGGISSNEQQIKDTVSAENIVTEKLTVETCKKIG